MPDYAQFNRLLRAHHDSAVAYFRHLARQLNPAAGEPYLFEVLDGFGAAVRNVKRRGAGWLAGEAGVGRCGRLGWYEGLHVLTAVNPAGAITGFGFAPASTKDQHLAETFLAVRHTPDPRPGSVGGVTDRPYVTDT